MSQGLIKRLPVFYVQAYTEEYATKAAHRLRDKQRKVPLLSCTGPHMEICCHACKNEECPDTFRHPGYYEKIYLCVIHPSLTDSQYTTQM